VRARDGLKIAHAVCMAHSLFSGWIVSVLVYAVRGGAPLGPATANTHGAMLQVSTPFDSPAPPSTAAHVAIPTRAIPALAANFARQVVDAAVRAAGLAEHDTDDLVARSRLAAWLPEARVRVAGSDTLRNDDGDNGGSSSTSTSGSSSSSSAASGKLYWEGRAAWRLDRIVYSGEEPGLQRIRLDQAEARARIAHRTLEALFLWERARLDLAAGPSDEATLRVNEAACTLDVLTSGWFTRQARAQQ
jgi:hypothetical protein